MLRVFESVLTTMISSGTPKSGKDTYTPVVVSLIVKIVFRVTNSLASRGCLMAFWVLALISYEWLLINCCHDFFFSMAPSLRTRGPYAIATDVFALGFK